MPNEWWELAQTVPDTLLEVCTSEEALRLIDLAITKFEAQAELLRTIRNGATHEDATEGYVDPDPAGVLPTALLEDARRDIKRCSSLHGLAARVLPLCAESMDLIASAETNRSWESHNDAAINHAHRAQMRLCNAASFYKAAMDAVDMDAVLPVGVPLRRAGMLAAEQLTNNAANEVTLARGNVYEMRHALCLQFFVAWEILWLG